MNPIPDHLAWGLDVLFVGFNPSPRSGRRAIIMPIRATASGRSCTGPA